jgi:hypothetical protein
MNVRPILVGELGLLSLFDLVQLLVLNGATGTLRVASSGRQGHFRFERGQVAGALDDQGPDGIESAYRLFTWRTGTFAFSVGTPGSVRTIEDSTEAVMLEAARRMDEAGATHASPFHTTTLQARMQALSSWRASLEKVAPGITKPLAEALQPVPVPEPQPVPEPSPVAEAPAEVPAAKAEPASPKGSKRRRRGKRYRDAA